MSCVTYLYISTNRCANASCCPLPGLRQSSRRLMAKLKHSHPFKADRPPPSQLPIRTGTRWSTPSRKIVPPPVDPRTNGADRIRCMGQPSESTDTQCQELFIDIRALRIICFCYGETKMSTFGCLDYHVLNRVHAGVVLCEGLRFHCLRDRSRRCLSPWRVARTTVGALPTGHVAFQAMATEPERGFI